MIVNNVYIYKKDIRIYNFHYNFLSTDLKDYLVRTINEKNDDFNKILFLKNDDVTKKFTLKPVRQRIKIIKKL